jgi:hypothetical protein
MRGYDLGLGCIGRTAGRVTETRLFYSFHGGESSIVHKLSISGTLDRQNPTVGNQALGGAGGGLTLGVFGTQGAMDATDRNPKLY